MPMILKFVEDVFDAIDTPRRLHAYIPAHVGPMDQYAARGIPSLSLSP